MVSDSKFRCILMKVKIRTKVAEQAGPAQPAMDNDTQGVSNDVQGTSSLRHLPDSPEVSLGSPLYSDPGAASEDAPMEAEEAPIVAEGKRRKIKKMRSCRTAGNALNGPTPAGSSKRCRPRARPLNKATKTKRARAAAVVAADEREQPVQGAGYADAVRRGASGPPAEAPGHMHPDGGTQAEPCHLRRLLEQHDRDRRVIDDLRVALDHYALKAHAHRAQVEERRAEQMKIQELRARNHELQEQLDVSRAETLSLREMFEEISGESPEQQSAAAGQHAQLAQCADLRQLINASKARKKASQVQPLSQGDIKALQSILSKPQVFEGYSTKEHVRDWLNGVKEYIALVGSQFSVNKQVAVAATYLKGEALRVWQQYTVHASADLTWDQFQQVLLDRYDTGTDAVTARYKLDALEMPSKQPVVKHVQKFDMLLSYIPDMTEAEKVHRFLSSVTTEVHDRINLDPNTNQRWVRYSDLRKYVLRLFAYQIAAVAAAGGAFATRKRPGRLQGHSIPGDKRQKTDAWQHPRPKQRGTPGASSSGQQRAAEPPREGHRNKAVRDWCMERGLCFRCYASGHLGSTCTEPHAKGNPPGFRPSAPK